MTYTPINQADEQEQKIAAYQIGIVILLVLLVIAIVSEYRAGVQDGSSAAYDRMITRGYIAGYTYTVSVSFFGKSIVIASGENNSTK